MKDIFIKNLNHVSSLQNGEGETTEICTAEISSGGNWEKVSLIFENDDNYQAHTAGKKARDGELLDVVEGVEDKVERVRLEVDVCYEGHDIDYYVEELETALTDIKNRLQENHD